MRNISKITETVIICLIINRFRKCVHERKWYSVINKILLVQQTCPSFTTCKPDSGYLFSNSHVSFSLKLNILLSLFTKVLIFCEDKSLEYDSVDTKMCNQVVQTKKGLQESGHTHQYNTETDLQGKTHGLQLG